MAGEVTQRKNGRDSEARPSWVYEGKQEFLQLEMLESVRNVLDSIRSSQMLQCDVAWAIKGIQSEMQKTRQILARIDRRLAKVEKFQL